MNNSGKLIVISAPAGCGKDTIVEKLFNSDYKTELNLFYSISATTRPIRDGEQEGVHYFFMNREKFESLIEEGEFLEHTEYCGNYYGTRNKSVMDALGEGKNIVMKIEHEGAENVRRLFPDSLLIFIMPPSMEELRRRLQKRSTEDEETINQRLAKAEIEIGGCYDYDYQVINDDLTEAVNEVATIINEEINKE